MRIAITGGTGFVGSHLASHLSEQGHELVLVSRGKRPSDPAGPAVTRVAANVVSGSGLVEAFAGCDAVVNLVAVIVEKRGQTFDAVNRQGAANVARATVEAGVGHLVHLSAIGADPDPRFGYLASKWSGEQAIRISGIPHTIIRSSLVFIAGDGRTLFQPIAAEDIARCIGLALERGPDPRVFAVGGPDHLSYEQIVDIIRREVVSLPRIKLHVPVPAIRPVAALMAAVMRDPLVTPAQLDLLGHHNITIPGVVAAVFGFEPQRFSDRVGYLRRRGR
jgi:NADH dehydrogenase